MKRKPPPEGWDLIEPTIEMYEQKMKEAVEEPHEGMRKAMSTWMITKLHFEKNRFIYEAHYKDKKISKELYEWLVDMKLADQMLIAKWRKPGYETLCSLMAITKNNTAFGTASICRVPIKARSGTITPAVNTGCISCASGDGGPIWWNDPRPDFNKDRRDDI